MRCRGSPTGRLISTADELYARASPLFERELQLGNGAAGGHGGGAFTPLKLRSIGVQMTRLQVSAVETGPSVRAGEWRIDEMWRTRLGHEADRGGRGENDEAEDNDEDEDVDRGEENGDAHGDDESGTCLEVVKVVVEAGEKAALETGGSRVNELAAVGDVVAAAAVEVAAEATPLFEVWDEWKADDELESEEEEEEEEAEEEEEVHTDEPAGECATEALLMAPWRRREWGGEQQRSSSCFAVGGSGSKRQRQRTLASYVHADRDVLALVDMGFAEAEVRVALLRCEDKVAAVELLLRQG